MVSLHSPQKNGFYFSQTKNKFSLDNKMSAETDYAQKTTI